MTVAALYVDGLGVYPIIDAVDSWNESRDARLYEGPHPIVAHPPCRHWSRMRHLANVSCFDCDWRGRVSRLDYDTGDELPACPRCGGEPDWSDRDCAPRAVEQVRRWGGVLEHPAGSLLWEHCGLPVPVHASDPSDKVRYYSPFGLAHRDWAVEVDQVEWGHVARKRTWLYLVGVPREALEAPPFPGREPTHRCGSTTLGRADGSRYRPTSNLRSASAQQRRRTPPLFAEYLVRLARSTRAHA